MRLGPELQCEAERLIGRRLGLRLPPERLPDLVRVLEEGLRASGLRSAEDYLRRLDRLSAGGPEWSRIAARVTVGETYFFRDHAVFEGLEQHILPALIAARRGEGVFRLRLWSAGCATGEEPYSLAILLDRLLLDRAAWTITILATDINQDALATAQRGHYREWSLRETPDVLRDRYFRARRGASFELAAHIREMVTFAPLNLAEDIYPSLVTNTSAMDLILCRNVLMYFDPETQRQSVIRLQHSLLKGGWLAVSPVEDSAELLRPLVPVQLPETVFHRKTGSHEALLPPAPPLVPMNAPVLERPLADEALPTAPTSLGRAELEDGGGLLAKARSLADQGQLESARRVAEAAVAEMRLDPEGHLLLAAIRQELGDALGARASLRRAIYLAPDSAPAHFLLGTLLLRDGERRSGRRCLENAIRLLEPLAAEQAVEGAGGLTAGRLRETARSYLAEA